MVKCKSVPLEARSDQDGSRKLSFPDNVTTAQDGGTVVSLTHRPLFTPGNTPGTQSNSQLLALVSFVFRDKILKHIHTH